MYKILGVSLMIASAALGAGWVSYTIPGGPPPDIDAISDVACNELGEGYAFGTTGLANKPGTVLRLHNGVWSPLSPPPTTMGDASIGSDGSLYAIDWEALHGWRLKADGRWEIVVSAGGGKVKFWDIVAVTANEFWIIASRADGNILIIHYLNKIPVHTFDCGPCGLTPPTAGGYLCLPRSSGPGSDVYAVVPHVYPTWHAYRNVLYVCHANGTFEQYPIPTPYGKNECVESAVSPAYGQVRFSVRVNYLTTHIYSFSGGTFRYLGEYPERICFRCYPTRTDGWAITYTSRVFHWSDSGFGQFFDLDGTVRDVDFSSASTGWAVGYRTVNGTRVPAMWRYGDDNNILPTSLGKIKASYK